MVILLVAEMVLLALVLTGNGTGDVVVGITDTLQLRYLTQHGTYLCLGIVTQMSITHLVKVFGYLQFHIVGDTLIFLNPCKELVEITRLCAVALRCGTTAQCQQLAHHAEHTLHTLRECLYLFLCLQDGELGGLHETSGNEMQTEVLFLVDLLGLDDPADEFLNLWDKPDEDEGVRHIEAGVEGCQHETQFGGIGKESLGTCRLFRHVDIIADEAADHIDEGTEDK